jgi:flagellar M-ring protein FliF
MLKTAGAPGGALVTALSGGPVLGASGTAAAAGALGYDASLALPGPDVDQRIDIAKIEGQVKASSVKRVAEFVDRHPDESIAILRSWLHES